MRKQSLALAAALLALSASYASGQQTKVGMLVCNTSVNIGFIVGSQQKLSCTFSPEYGMAENYYGTIDRIGIDIGATSGGVISWAVLAPTAGLLRGALAGQYVGASGQVTVGVGLGANVLLGGSDRSIALQPLSIEGQTGLNVAGGITGLTLISDY
jgi:Protein of unknown function (DUF992)